METHGMKPIVVELTPEEAHNILALCDLALRHPTDGGMKIMKAVNAISDKIKLAVDASQKPDVAAC